MTVSKISKLTRTGKALAVASVLALSGLGAAQAMGHMDRMGGGRAGMAGHGGPEMMMGGRIEHMLDMVDATDAQRAQIKQIMSAARQDLKAQQTGGRGLQEQRMALFTAPNVDAAAIEALRQQISAQREAAGKRMGQAMVDAARVLTPEQRAKLAERIKKAQARMSEHKAERQQKAGKGQ
jgi:Spy/CpxP family protein refolding chaperone